MSTKVGSLTLSLTCCAVADSADVEDAGEETDDDVPQPADDDAMTDDDQPTATADAAQADAADTEDAAADEDNEDEDEDEDADAAAAEPAGPSFNATAAHSFKSAAYLAKKAASSASRFRQAKVIISGEQYHKYPPTVPAYPHLRAASSQYPKRRYCDVTHYAAAYTDPRTRLHYADKVAFAVVRTWGREEVNARLALRRAQPSEIK